MITFLVSQDMVEQPTSMSPMMVHFPDLYEQDFVQVAELPENNAQQHYADVSSDRGCPSPDIDQGNEIGRFMSGIDECFDFSCAALTPWPSIAMPLPQQPTCSSTTTMHKTYQDVCKCNIYPIEALPSKQTHHVVQTDINETKSLPINSHIATGNITCFHQSPMHKHPVEKITQANSTTVPVLDIAFSDSLHHTQNAQAFAPLLRTAVIQWPDSSS